MELESYFQGLLGNIEPAPGNVTIAKKAHEKLRNELHNDDEISKADPDTFLAGSYARDTAIKGIKDVDVVLLIDMDHRATEPSVVIAWVQDALQRHYDDVRPQGRSVGVTTDGDFQLDVVPAVPISRRDGPLWIPDRDVKAWVASHPKGQIESGIKKNAFANGRYKPLVKAMKHWRDGLTNPDAHVKSYILENLTAESLVSPPDSYAQAVCTVLSAIQRRYTPYANTGTVPTIMDQGYPSVNVAKRWTVNEFNAFMREIATASTMAKSALDSTDENTSVKLWRVLFGQDFSQKR